MRDQVRGRRRGGQGRTEEGPPPRLRLPACAPRPGATASTLIEHFPTNSSRNWEADDGARFRIATPRAVSDQKIDFFRGYTCAKTIGLASKAGMISSAKVRRPATEAP